MVSPIEKELLFNLWSYKNNTRQFLLDLDDTICETGKIFRTQMVKASNLLAMRAPSLSPEGWMEVITLANNRLFDIGGVSPQRWNFVVDELTQQYSFAKNIQEETKQTFARIYSTSLKMLPGAEAGLRFLQRVNMPFGIVTHANQDWTWRKYNWLKLGRFVSWDNIYIVNENGHKTSESWMQAVRYFKQEIKQCAVVGDSPRSDINPARDAGIEHCFLIKSAATAWSIHQQPVDSNVHLIEDLSQLAEIGLSQLSEFKPRTKH